MIDEAIQTTISEVISCSLLDNAKEDEMPFAVFNVKTTAYRMKEGISHYTTTGRITVVAEEIATVREKAAQIASAIDTMADQTINDTEVISSFYTATEPDLLEGGSDSDQILYVEDIDFTVKHKTQ